MPLIFSSIGLAFITGYLLFGPKIYEKYPRNSKEAKVYSQLYTKGFLVALTLGSMVLAFKSVVYLISL